VTMKPTIRRALLISTFLLTAAPNARAASLQQVSNWGVPGLPSDVTMYVYVPDKVASNPPILTLIHYCGGTAPAVFGHERGWMQLRPQRVRPERVSGDHDSRPRARGSEDRPSP
jgi:hypothetical protein